MTRLASLIALTLAATFALADEKVSLKYDYPPGQYDMHCVVAVNSQIEAKGQTIPQDMAMVMDISMVAGKPDANGVKKIEFGFSRLQNTVKMNGKVMAEYDSADPNRQSGPQASMYQAFSKAKMSFDLGPDGGISSVQGLDGLFAFDKDSNADPRMVAQMAQMQKKFGDSMKGMFEDSAKALPNKPVGPGDTWEYQINKELPLLGEAKIQAQCKLIKIEQTPQGGKTAVIESAIKFATDKPTSMPGPESVQITMSGITVGGKATILVDVATGLQSQVNMDMDMALTISVKAANEDSTSNIKTKMKTEMTTAKHAPAKAE